MENKLTKNRQAVLDVLRTSPSAMSAYDVLDSLHAQDSKWKPATVYRALNYLIETDLIHRIESEQKFICCEHQHTHHDRYFQICELCGSVEEQVLPKGLIQELLSLSAQNDFALSSPYLELKGRCSECQQQSET